MADDTPTSLPVAVARRALIEEVGNIADQYTLDLIDALIAAVRAEEQPRCIGRYDGPIRGEPFQVTYRCGLVAGHDGPHQSDDGDTLWKDPPS